MTQYVSLAAREHLISIHTFLAEGDIKIKEWAIGTDISIHTFLAEGDDIQLFGSREADVFQSTPSSRKVTPVLFVLPEVQSYFNPHLPRGR